FFYSHEPATAYIYTLSLHDALPICSDNSSTKAGSVDDIEIAVGKPFAISIAKVGPDRTAKACLPSKISSATSNRSRPVSGSSPLDRKSTRLNSSHVKISYAVFCLKK